MKVLLLVIITISFFLVPTLVRKWRNIPVLIAVTVAAAVNTNYYLSFDYPVEMGIFIFGMDALVGFIYIYSLIIVTFESSTKHAYELAISSVAAIVLAGIIETCAKTASNGGLTYETGYPFLFNLVSAVACLIGGFLAIYLADKIRNTGFNVYLAIAFSCLVGGIVHYILFSLGLMISKPDILQEAAKYNSCVYGGLLETVILIPLGLLNYFFSKKVLKIKNPTE